MIDLIIESIFFGFGILSISKAFVSDQRNINYKTIDFKKIDQSAIFLVRFTGIAYLIIYLIKLYTGYIAHASGNLNGQEFETVSRLFGPYWFAYWAYMLFYPITSQLLWIKKVCESRWFRFSLGLLYLFSYEKFVILLTTFHRDYILSSGIIEILTAMVINWLLHLLIFAVVLAAVMCVLGKRKTLYNPI